MIGAGHGHGHAGGRHRWGHGIEHATLQVEVIPARECHAAAW